MKDVIIRSVSVDEDMWRVTEVIRAAYAKHAANDLRYWATHQPPEDTARRFAAGQGFIAEASETIVGTVTVRPPDPNSKVFLFRDPSTWTLGQFAVLPDCQGFGIGRRLHQAACDHALAKKGRVIALDTAAPAVELIEMYKRWGYRVVGECDWRPKTNYLSVVMSRRIGEECSQIAAQPSVES